MRWLPFTVELVQHRVGGYVTLTLRGKRHELQVSWTQLADSAYKRKVPTTPQHPRPAQPWHEMPHGAPGTDEREERIVKPEDLKP